MWNMVPSGTFGSSRSRKEGGDISMIVRKVAAWTALTLVTLWGIRTGQAQLPAFEPGVLIPKLVEKAPKPPVSVHLSVYRSGGRFYDIHESKQGISVSGRRWGGDSYDFNGRVGKKSWSVDASGISNSYSINGSGIMAHLFVNPGSASLSGTMKRPDGKIISLNWSFYGSDRDFYGFSANGADLSIFTNSSGASANGTIEEEFFRKGTAGASGCLPGRPDPLTRRRLSRANLRAHDTIDPCCGPQPPIRGCSPRRPGHRGPLPKDSAREVLII